MNHVQHIPYPKINPVQTNNKKVLKLAFLTHWCQPTAFSEFSLSLVEELFRLGHETYILAPQFTDALPQIADRSDGKGVLRFDSNTKVSDIVAQLEEWKITHLFVHKECFPDQKKLEMIVQEFGAKGKSTYLFVHSETYDTKFRYALFTNCIIPSRVFSKIPPGNGRMLFLDQGVPEFEELDLTPEVENKWREERMIPYPVTQKDQSATPSDTLHDDYYDGYVLNTFDGKSTVEEILNVLKYINDKKIVGKKIYLQVHCADKNNIGRYMDLDSKYDNLVLSLSYSPADVVAKCFTYSEGAIFIYPDFKDKQTSAAIRFCIGSLCPIITNDGNHIKDIPREAIMTLAPNNQPASIKHAIVTHFQRLALKKSGARRMHKLLINQKGWSKIAKELEDVLLRVK
jgi:hypothetical protein